MKAGRNEPCPCGSGKKYKKCCMQAQEINENAKRSLKEKLIEFSREPIFKTDLEKAKKIFLGGREPDEADMVVNWFIHDEIKDHHIHEGSIKFETSLISDAGDPQFRSMGDLTINNNWIILDCLSEKISESKQHNER